jgi:hypothetical protein
MPHDYEQFQRLSASTRPRAKGYAWGSLSNGRSGLARAACAFLGALAGCIPAAKTRTSGARKGRIALSVYLIRCEQLQSLEPRKDARGSHTLDYYTCDVLQTLLAGTADGESRVSAEPQDRENSTHFTMFAQCRLSLRLRKYHRMAANVERGQERYFPLQKLLGVRVQLYCWPSNPRVSRGAHDRRKGTPSPEGQNEPYLALRLAGC